MASKPNDPTPAPNDEEKQKDAETEPSRSEAGVPEGTPANPEKLDLDPQCPTCHGTRVVVVQDASGKDVKTACPECAPNDAPGG